MDAISALNQANTFRNQALAMMQQRATQQSQGPPPPPPGSLIIHDSFEYSTFEFTATGPQRTPPPPTNSNSRHGEVAKFSAQEHGFSGPVVKREIPFDKQGAQSQAAKSALYLHPMDKTKALDAIRTSIGANAASLLNGQASMLNQSSAAGTRNSAVNISQGTSKARSTEQHYEELTDRLQSQKPEVAKEARLALGNYAAAFDFDPSKFLSTDPKVSGPEKAKLVQGLVNESSAVLDSSKGVAAARDNYNQAVTRFEANHNSVVVSAGNEGGSAQRLARVAPRLRIPPDFSKNVLENEEVTSVGATRWIQGSNGLQEQAAPYNSTSSGIDIYASGSVGFANPNRKEVWGTSFASPRVAAAMAELHRQNPEMSSAQIETLMKTQLTHQLPSGGQQLPVLDFGKTYEFLKTQKF